MTTTSDLYRTKPKRATWLGVPGTAIEIARTKNAATRCGERVALTVWEVDANDRNGERHAGSVSARHLTGDGRYEHTLHAEALLPNLASAEAWAADRLAR